MLNNVCNKVYTTCSLGCFPVGWPTACTAAGRGEWCAGSADQQSLLPAGPRGRARWCLFSRRLGDRRWAAWSGGRLEKRGMHSLAPLWRYYTCSKRQRIKWTSFSHYSVTCFGCFYSFKVISRMIYFNNLLLCTTNYICRGGGGVWGSNTPPPPHPAPGFFFFFGGGGSRLLVREVGHVQGHPYHVVLKIEWTFWGILWNLKKFLGPPPPLNLLGSWCSITACIQL